ncbi:hypothetical protein ME763_32145 [Streptomyces murinus]|uniref:hypothetical protein n=1 Tax=Streptomyces murinus TaxID=33900 RepID=UPI00117E1109|nr:hypothetical protein [Streptomyces murinus]WDO09942.1 hypothetical protein ME763_32145 [Streptomyces murinus]
MNLDVNSLVNLAATLGAVALGSWLTARTTARADAKAEQGALGAQFDAMVHAVADLRAAVDANRSLWSNPMETARAGVLATMAALGVAAFAKEPNWHKAAAGAGGAAWILAQERAQVKTATASIVPKLAAVAHAAAPLLRHSNVGIREATDGLMASVFRYQASDGAQEVETAAENFGRAVQAVLNPAPQRRPWQRGDRRRNLAPHHPQG